MVTITTTTFSIGIVSYLLRAGSILASFASTLPLWRGFDPIAVFTGDKKKLRKQKKLPVADEISPESIFESDEE